MGFQPSYVFSQTGEGDPGHFVPETLRNHKIRTEVSGHDYRPITYNLAYNNCGRLGRTHGSEYPDDQSALD